MPLFLKAKLIYLLANKYYSKRFSFNLRDKYVSFSGVCDYTVAHYKERK